MMYIQTKFYIYIYVYKGHGGEFKPLKPLPGFATAETDYLICQTILVHTYTSAGALAQL